MIDALFNQPAYAGAKKMLDATELRQKAIAANIANLETPDYHRVDLAPSFQKELDQALASGNTTQINDLKPSVVVDKSAVSPNRDGNTVHLEHEMLELNENNLEHAVNTQLIDESLVRLRLAITGKTA